MSRKIAFDVLCDVNINKTYVNISLKENLKNVKQIDASFITRIVFGVLQNQILLDFYIKNYTNNKKIKPKILQILRIGVYQILFMDKVPDNASVNECVNLTKKIKLNQLSGFVNGVLRKISREKDNLPEIPNNSDYLSIKYSHPSWLIDKLSKEFDDIEPILISNNTPAPVFCRVNTLKTSCADILQSMDNAKEVYENAIMLSKSGDIEKLDCFKNGQIYVQDLACQMCIKTLNPTPNSVVIDCCSAPGGKAFLMAQYMQNKGEIFAFDIYEHKTKIIEKTANRLSIDIIKPLVCDASVFDEQYSKCADFVLCDAPCSGLGIIRRKPEIRYKQDISQLPNIQFNILNNVSKYVKDGGVLVYSTCTIISDENECVVNKFLEQNPDFYLDEDQGMVTLLPHINNTDGFFIAKLRRK